MMDLQVRAQIEDKCQRQLRSIIGHIIVTTEFPQFTVNVEVLGTLSLAIDPIYRALCVNTYYPHNG